MTTPKEKILIVALLLISTSRLTVFGTPEVSNVRASQNPESQKVNIVYDLAGTNSEYAVSLNVSTNHGASYSIYPQSLSGSGIGIVPPGINKVIEWNAPYDWPGRYSSAVRFRVTATPPAIATNIYVSMSSGGFVWSSNASVGFLGNGTGKSTLIQLIWSANSNAEPAQASSINYVSGDDIWLADYIFTENGVKGDYDHFAYFHDLYIHEDAMPSAGYIYARVFEDSFVEIGDWYYTGPVISARDIDPASVPMPMPQAYNLWRGSLNTGEPLNADVDAIDGLFGAQVSE